MSFRHRSMFFFSSSYHSDDEVCTERQSYLLHTSESDMACRPLLHLKYQLTAMISKVRATFSHTIIIIIDGHCCFLWCYIIHYLLISWCIHWTTTTTTASYSFIGYIVGLVPGSSIDLLWPFHTNDSNTFDEWSFRIRISLVIGMWSSSIIPDGYNRCFGQCSKHVRFWCDTQQHHTDNSHKFSSENLNNPLCWPM